MFWDTVVKFAWRWPQFQKTLSEHEFNSLFNAQCASSNGKQNDSYHNRSTFSINNSLTPPLDTIIKLEFSLPAKNFSAPSN